MRMAAKDKWRKYFRKIGFRASTAGNNGNGESNESVETSTIWSTLEVD